MGFKAMSRSISWLITNLLRSWHNSYDIFDHMLPVTEESLLIAKQPQKLFRDFHVPVAVVADMIREAAEQSDQYMKEFPEAYQYLKSKKDALTHARSFFAARRHAYKNNIYVVRIHYRFSKMTPSKHKYAVHVYHAEIMEEREYQPILPM